MATRYRTREATAADIPRLIDMLVRMDAHVAGADPDALALNEHGYQNLQDRLAALIGNPWALVVVVVTPQGALVAMGNVSIWHDPDFWHNEERKGTSSAVIDDIWVEPDHRRHGITKRMLKRLLDFAAQHHVAHLTLEYSLANPEAHAVWEKLGFRPTGVRAAATLSEVRARLGHQQGKDIDR